jgi:hypothetical protein
MLVQFHYCKENGGNVESKHIVGRCYLTTVRVKRWRIHDTYLKQQIDAFTSELHTMFNTWRSSEERVNFIFSTVLQPSRE